jgi:hypothetical protein
MTIREGNSGLMVAIMDPKECPATAISADNGLVFPIALLIPVYRK